MVKAKDFKLISPGEVRVRYAPSPTGPFHIGSARTALFNFLFAQKYQGTFILRIEDTDIARSKKEYEENIIESLKWLGITWQEGPDVGGQYGPYRQSERKEIYRKYIEKLLAEDKIYYCFCSQDELEAYRQYLMSLGKAPIYSGKCRNLTKEEVQEKLQKREKFVLRFKTPIKKIVFYDLIRGKIEFNSEELGDFVIAKDLDSPLYNLAAVIDDYEMKITHVIRGEDHISNTPKQILLQEALGFYHPEYIHIPLILGPDRAKLSKRHGAKSVMEYKKEGYLPEAIVNFLALLGWHPREEKEIFSMSYLVNEFSLEGIQKSGAVFNIEKLNWMNGFYIRKTPIEKLTNLVIPYLIEANLIEALKADDFPTNEFLIKEINQKINFDYIKKIVSIYQERLKFLSEIVSLTSFFFKDKLNFEKDLLRWKNMSDIEIENSLLKTKEVLLKIDEKDWTKENLEKILLTKSVEIGNGDRGRVLWPLRVALSGERASAGPFEIAEILGKEKTLKRIEDAISLLKRNE
jgi:glutamyl-tRNA synthetase